MTSDEYVTKAEWDAWCQEERRRYWERKQRENEALYAKWKKEHDRLMNPPPPPPKPKPPPEPPDIDDPSYADYVFSLNADGIRGIETGDGEDD